MTTALQRNRRVVERFDAILNTGRLDELDELCTPDMVNHTLAPGRPPGLAGTREFLATQGRDLWQGDRWQQMTVVAEGDYVVQFGTRVGRWPGGDFRGVEMPPGDYTRDFAVVYRLREARIVERWAVRDDFGMMAQLGAFARR